MLHFDHNWRFDPPGTVEKSTVNDLVKNVIHRIASDCSKKYIMETFKRRFAQVVGDTAGESSSESWAETDLHSYMMDAGKQNAALFCEALYDGLMDISSISVNNVIPPWDYVNKFLSPCGFSISPPNLVLADNYKPIPVPSSIPTLTVRANEMIQKSLSDSETHLVAGRNRAAVQEILWLLETISTVFRGLAIDEKNITGKYFSKIIGDLRRMHNNSTLDKVFQWLENIYGYLSAPDGGGVRHGAALNQHIEMTSGEARLFCDLSRSYINYLLHEHARLSGANLDGKSCDM
ncbi:TPA: hypothetical protein ACXI8I_000350 [Serratia marcescens]